MMLSAVFTRSSHAEGKIERMLTKVPADKKDVWVQTAKIGAWALLSQKTFIFLDKHFVVKRQVA